MRPTVELARRVVKAGTRPRAARTLLLDLDGTLAPFAPTPGEARVPPETQAALAQLLSQDWTIAIVSGRPADEVREMLPLSGMLIFGSHGMEGCWPGRQRAASISGLQQRLDLLKAQGQALAAATPGVLVECKPYGIAFHDRKVNSSALASWREQLDSWLALQDLEELKLLRGNRVVELLPRTIHKGLVIQQMPRQPGMPVPDDSFVAIGDDHTDEDLFREISGLGLSVHVGRPGKPSLAEARLASPAAVRDFLCALTRSG